MFLFLVVFIATNIASPTPQYKETMDFAADEGAFGGYPASLVQGIMVDEFHCNNQNGLCCTGDDNTGDNVWGPDHQTGPILFDCLHSTSLPFDPGMITG